MASSGWTRQFLKIRDCFPDQLVPVQILWTSTDSFTVYHMGFPITEPIINYSTYTEEDSTGQQAIYLYQDFLGDTLSVTGSVDQTSIYDNLQFIIY